MYFNFPHVTLLDSFTTVMGRCICKPLGADMMHHYITGLKVALNTLAQKWGHHITYWTRKQVGWISQSKTLPKVFLLLYSISTFISSRALNNSIFRCPLAAFCYFLTWEIFLLIQPSIQSCLWHSPGCCEDSARTNLYLDTGNNSLDRTETDSVFDWNGK